MKSQQCTALEAIKSKAVLKSVAAALEALYVSEQTGTKSEKQIDYDIQRAKDFSKNNCAPNGVSYFRNICLSLANKIVDAASINVHFIPPTEETLSWGGFMGGTDCVWTDRDREKEAEIMVVKLIKEIATGLGHC